MNVPPANLEKREFKHRELTEKIIGVFYQVYNELGHGFLESVYEEAMLIALIETDLKTAQQVPTPVWFRGRAIGTLRPIYWWTEQCFSS
jgi:GxxExxY protein